MKPFKLLVMSFIIILFLYQNAFSGNRYDVWCTYNKCDFKIQFQLGRNMFSNPPTPVYCSKCNSVYTFMSCSEYDNSSTNENKIFKPTKPVGKIWSFYDNETIEIFNCPVCNNICNEIKSPEKMKYCPKCQNNTLKSRISAWTD